MKDILWESKSQVIHLFFMLQLIDLRGFKCNGFSLIDKNLKSVKLSISYSTQLFVEHLSVKDILWESKSQVIHLFFMLQLIDFRGFKCNGFSLIDKNLKSVKLSISYSTQLFVEHLSVKDILWESKSQVIHLFFMLQLIDFRGFKCNGFSLIDKNFKSVKFQFHTLPNCLWSI